MTYRVATLTSDVSLPGATWQDGLRIDLGIGTWLLLAVGQIGNPANDNQGLGITGSVQLTNGNDIYVQSNRSGYQNYFLPIPVAALVPLATPTSIWLQASFGPDPGTTGLLIKSGSASEVGNSIPDGSAAVNQTYLIAVQVDPSALSGVTSADFALTESPQTAITLSLTAGLWDLVALGNFSSSITGSEVMYFMQFWNGTFADHFMDDEGFSDGNPNFCTWLVTRAADVPAGAESWSLSCGRMPGFAGDTFLDSGSMICAIPADDVREWPLDADISFSTDAWIEGPGVPLSEGEWLVTAAAHFTVTEPFHGIVYAELFDGANEYGLQARTFRRSIFSGNNAIGIINTMAVLDVGAEGATVTLRVRAHSDHPENAHNFTPASGVLEAVCPAVIPVPGQPPPETPENPHQSNFATHITAAKLQTIVPSPLLERLAADASVVWSRNTFP